MTYKITIEIDATLGQSDALFVALADWAHTGDTDHLTNISRLSPAVMLEPHHPDDDELAEAVQHLRRLGFDTAAAAVQTARRNLTAEPGTEWDGDLHPAGICPDPATRDRWRLTTTINNPKPHPLLDRAWKDITARMAAANNATERRLHARAAVDTHQARGGRVL